MALVEHALTVGACDSALPAARFALRPLRPFRRTLLAARAALGDVRRDLAMTYLLYEQHHNGMLTANVVDIC